MNKELLLKLADLLDTVPPEKFEYTSWANWGDGKEHLGEIPNPADMTCGTTGCAIGWATTMPECQALGLELFLVEGNLQPRVKGSPIVLSNSLIATVDVGHSVFDLSEEDFDYLFVPMNRHSPLPGNASAKDVALLIRDFVNGEMREPWTEDYAYELEEGEIW